MYLFLPVYNVFINYLDDDKQREKLFFIITLLMLLINDISKNQFLCVAGHSLENYFGHSIILLYGHFVYKYREYYNKRLVTLFSFLSFVLILLIRSKLTYYWTPRGTFQFLFEFSLIGVAQNISFAIFCLSLNRLFRDGYISKMITYIAGTTFGIYIIHLVILARLQVMGIQDKLGARLLNRPSFVKTTIYMIVMVVIVFSIAFVLLQLLR